MSSDPKSYRSRPDPAIGIIMDAIDAAGWSLEKVAQKSGVSPSCLYNWRNRATHHPQHITLSAVARAIGLQWVLLRRNA
jgi:lambda repressor-like predicted transcriptional regulator